MIHFYISPKYFDVSRLNYSRPGENLIQDFAAELYLNGPMAWIVPTFLRLKSSGLSCCLTNDIPDQGIIVATYRETPLMFRPTRNQFFVSIREDGYYNPFAHIHISQNPRQCKEVRNSFFIPFWPQPGIIPRSTTRGDRFENVGFFGYRENLAKELKSDSWIDFLKSHGLNWQSVGLNDDDDSKLNYSNLDCVVAVRELANGNRFLHKPANKLFNAWQSKVPAILGAESAFQEARKCKLDYVEVNTYQELCNSLIDLQTNPSLRQEMVENGQIRFQDYTVEKTTKRWMDLFNRVIIPRSTNWQKSTSANRYQFFARCYLQLRKKGMIHRLKRGGQKFFSSSRLNKFGS